jgi:hypothetical protein
VHVQPRRQVRHCHADLGTRSSAARGEEVWVDGERTLTGGRSASPVLERG